MSIEEIRGGDVLTLRLEGTFDGPAAVLLRQSLERLADAQVVLDFSQVRVLRDAAVHVLMRGLARPAVRLKGLGRHQERLLRYLGVITPTQESWAREEMLS